MTSYKFRMSSGQSHSVGLRRKNLQTLSINQAQ